MSDTPLVDAVLESTDHSLLVVSRDLERALNECVEALGEYTAVVESVNDPNSFSPQIKDSGAPARNALAHVAKLREKYRG